MKIFFVIILSIFTSGITDICAIPKGKTRSEKTLFEGKVEFYFKPGPGQYVPEKVSVAGYFNGWEPDDEEYTLMPTKNDSFSVSIELNSGKQIYKYILDGKWVYDMEKFSKENRIKPQPHAFINDGFGGKNAVLEIDKK
jgi:hypothetical protein